MTASKVLVSKASPSDSTDWLEALLTVFVNNLFEEECGCIFLCFHLVKTEWVLILFLALGLRQFLYY